jgi:hypothetical protein
MDMVTRLKVMREQRARGVRQIILGVEVEETEDYMVELIIAEKAVVAAATARKELMVATGLPAEAKRHKRIREPSTGFPFLAKYFWGAVAEEATTRRVQLARLEVVEMALALLSSPRISSRSTVPASCRPMVTMDLVAVGTLHVGTTMEMVEAVQEVVSSSRAIQSHSSTATQRQAAG